MNRRRAAVVLRWRRGSAIERLQLRWPGLATGFTFVCFFATWLAVTGSPAYDTASVLFIVGLLAIPVAVVAAVLRCRLYDIDRVISRTVASVLVTAGLAGLCFGVVAFTTRVLDLGSALAVAASTLAAAALFTPLRRRLQRQVDRRFNRAGYDADATLAAFTGRLRDTVALETVRAHPLRTIAGAIEPAHAMLWLREPSGGAADERVRS